jgi:transcriptional regulator with XRE-family HTH domain
VKASRALKYARSRAGLSQRQLAEKAGIPQSTVGRIESGAVDPRFETLMTLLRTCGFDLEVEPRLGVGVDRSQLRELLKMTPEQRIRNAATAARGIAAFKAARAAGDITGKSARPAA